MKTKVLPTDVTFTMPRGAGNGCLCSRCLLPIASEQPIKPKKSKQLPKGNYELRYHSKCWNGTIVSSTDDTTLQRIE